MAKVRTWLEAERIRFVLGSLIWVAVFVLVRAVAIEADPPVRLPNGARGQELWAEGAAKAQEARNWALFGVWQTNPADNYQFWRPQSPIWVYSLAAFLKVFGVSTAVHRAHSIAVAAVGFWLLLMHGRRLSSVAWCGLAIFLAGNFYYLHYTRVGLIEPMVNLFAIGMIYCCGRALTQPLWLLGATWSLALAVLSKMTGLFLAPVFAIVLVVCVSRHRQQRRVWLLVAANAALVLGALLLFTSSDEYRQRAIWNIAHMAYNKDGETELNTSRIDLAAIPARLLDGDRWSVAFFPLFPVAVVLGLPAILHTLRSVWRERRFSGDALAVLWFGAAFGSLLLTPSTYARFHLVLFPPVALLGARGLDLVWRWSERWPRARWALPATVLLALTYVDGTPYRGWYEKRTYSVRDTSRKVARLVGKRDAVFIGMWASWLTFDTPYKFYTVRSYFNVSKAALQQLGVTHLMLRKRDRSGALYRRQLPRNFAAKRRIKQFRIKGERITLYELPR